MKMIKIKNQLLYGILFVASLTISLYACKPSREDNGLQNEHANTYLTDEELDNYAAWEKEKQQGNYIQTHQDLLRQADDRMERLEEEIDELSPEKQGEARKEAEQLETRRTTLENKLQELEQANEQNWSQLKQEVDQVADSLEFSLEKIDKNVEFGSIWLIHF